MWQCVYGTAIGEKVKCRPDIDQELWERSCKLQLIVSFTRISAKTIPENYPPSHIIIEQYTGSCGMDVL